MACCASTAPCAPTTIAAGTAASTCGTTSAGAGTPLWLRGLTGGGLAREQALAAWLAEGLDEGGFADAWRAWEAGGGLCHHTPCLCGSCPCVTAALAPSAAAAAIPDDDIGSESVDVLGLGCPSDDDDLSDDDSDDAH